MRDQLDAMLLDLDGPLRDVEFRIVPLRAEARGASEGSFVVLEFAETDNPDLVYHDHHTGGVLLESVREVDRYKGYFAELERESLSREASVRELVWVVERLG
jgi:Domain of unknown function (DUF5753)